MFFGYPSYIVITYTYPSTTLREASLWDRTGDNANRLDYFYEDGVQTDLDWDANPLRYAARTNAATC
jgi:hypothetical protein